MKTTKVITTCVLILSLVFFIIGIILKLTKDADISIMALLGSLCLICYTILNNKQQKNDTDKK